MSRNNIISRSRRQYNICGSLNTVWNNLMETSIKMIHTINRNHIRTNTANLCAHFIKQGCDIDNFRFLGGILNNRTALRINGSHHDIDCSTH